MLTKKEERKMVARVTRQAMTTSGGISVPLRPMMGVKISNTTQMRNMKWTYGNARPKRYNKLYISDAPEDKREELCYFSSVPLIHAAPAFTSNRSGLKRITSVFEFFSQQQFGGQREGHHQHGHVG